MTVYRNKRDGNCGPYDRISLSDFVRRQTKKSRFSHWDMSDGAFLDMVHCEFDKGMKGYREGVLIVPINATHGFYSGVAVLKDGDKLVGKYEPRRPGEEPRKSTCVVGRKKMPAKKVDVVLYHRDVLCEDPEHVSLNEWEVVSVNCSPLEGPMPIAPMVLLHNHFGSSGGTSTNLSDSDLVAMLRESFNWWKDKAFVEGGDNE